MAVTEPGVIAFELDRFVAGDQRLEVAGHWLGVRGRRFVRPTLRAVGEGHSSRALAELEHKPWAPEEAGPWVAAFPWPGPIEGVERFELAVAPDLAVELPPPQNPDAESRRGSRGEELMLTAVQPDDRAGPSDPSGESRPKSRRRDRAAAELKAALAERNEAVTKRDEASAACEQAVGAREEAVRARDQAVTQRDQAVTQRDQAAGELDRLVAERDRAVADRDRRVALMRQTAAERDRAATELQSAKSHWAATTAERDDAAAERDDAAAERDDAAAERDQAIAERDQAITEHELAALELDGARADLARIRSEVWGPQRQPLPIQAARVVRPFEHDERTAPRARSAVARRWRGQAWATRLMTIAAMVAFILVLLIIIGSK
jgi:hypothetical protein